jgi:hypothetical protein
MKNLELMIVMKPQPLEKRGNNRERAIRESPLHLNCEEFGWPHPASPEGEENSVV